MDEQGQAGPKRQIGRFTLNDLVEERYGAQVWRAVDSTLNREVSLWLVSADPQLASDVDAATRIAATVDDRRILRTHDVFQSYDLLVIVTEWSGGEVLAHHLTAPLPAAEAARIAYEVAGAIESAHAKGIAHGRLRPANVLVGDDGEVRVSGLGIDAVLAGIDPVAGDDPVAADLNGIGSILYACLTARWPEGESDGVLGAPDVGDHTPPPSRLLADVPESLDAFAARTVISVDPPKDRPQLESAGQAHEYLGASLTDLTGTRQTLGGATAQRSDLMPRIAGGVAVILLVLGLAWAGWQLLTSDTTAAPEPAPTPSAEASASEAPTRPKPIKYRILNGTDFDPLGSGDENPEQVPLAYDGDKNTAWTTLTYYDKGLDNKPGLGLLLDLGAPRTIGAVSLDLVGNGTDLQVLTSNEPSDNPQDYDLMAQATEAGEKVRLKSAAPTSARYVLVWMTDLPQVDGGYRGGIREVRVTS